LPGIGVDPQGRTWVTGPPRGGPVHVPATSGYSSVPVHRLGASNYSPGMVPAHRIGASKAHTVGVSYGRRLGTNKVPLVKSAPHTGSPPTHSH
jgi:hypothetical protein